MSKAKQIEIVGQLQLLGFLTTNGTGCRFVGIDYKTEIVPGKGIKVSHPFGRIFKVSKFQGLVNADYAEAVRNRVAAMMEVDKSAIEKYELGKSSYVHPFPSAPCVVAKASNPNDGEYYLQYFPTEDKTESVFVNDKGEVLDKGEVKKYLYAKGVRVAWKPAVVSLKLANITEMRASGLILSTEDADAAKEALMALRDSKVEVPLNDPFDLDVDAGKQIAAQDSHQHTGGKPQFA
jgi:hypothetical protein